MGPPWAGAHSIWGRLRELGLLEVKERFVGDLIAVYNQLTRRCGGHKARFFLQMQEGKTLQDKREPVQYSTTETPDRYYGKKLQWGWWNTRIGFLPKNIEKLLERTLKQPATVGPALSRRLGQMSLRSSNQHCSTDPWKASMHFYSWIDILFLKGLRQI